jgi:hypothetical protein
MTEKIKENFCGLPLPDNEEVLLLQIEQNFDMPGEALGTDLLAFAILQRGKYLSMAIQRDIDQWMDSIDARMQSVQSAREFTAGIEAGYSFIIGTISAFRYIRGDYSSMKDFLRDGPGRGDIPLLGRKEIDRLYSVMNGSAIIDHGSHGDYAETSADIAYYDTWDYVFESLALEEMINKEKQNISDMLSINYREKDEQVLIETHIKGFERGLQNGVELYLQVAEEKVIDQIEKMYD